MSDDQSNNILTFTFGGKQTLDSALDLIPVQREKSVIVPREDGDDYQTARQAIHDALGTIKSAIEEAHDLAHQAQHARGYEVVGGLVAHQVAAAKALLDLQNAANPQGEGPKTINNTLMVSSADMLDILKDKGIDPTK